MLRLGVFTVLLMLSGTCLAGPWYAEIAYTASDGDLPTDNDQVLFRFDTDNSDSGWKLGLGYQTSDYLALELAYADLGEQTIRSEASGPALVANPNLDWFNPFSSNVAPPLFASARAFAVAGPQPLLAFGETLTAETQGIQLAAVGRLPLGERFWLSAQGGAFISRYKNTRRRPVYGVENGTVVVVGYREESETSHEPELFAGLGLGYDLDSAFSLELTWEKILNVGDDDTLEQDIDTYNLGVRYNF